MQEKFLFCRDCHKLFAFSVEEQHYFSKKGWISPCRCPACRKAKRERSQDPYEGWQSTMSSPRCAKRGHQRVHYSGLIIAGGLSN